MLRQMRIEYLGAFYHAMSQGDPREPVFRMRRMARLRARRKANECTQMDEAIV